jgi:hypothetical protein
MAGKKRRPKVEATRDPSDIDIAWVAGLYEGEGTCYEGKNRSTVVGIYQKDPEILYRCLEMFGGWIGQMRHSTPDKVCNIWSLGGDDARLFLQIIYPFMSTRRKVQIDKTSFRAFTGVARNTRPEMSEERKAARAFMTAREKKKESIEQWNERNRERYLANMRLAQRRKYAKRRSYSEGEAVSIQ